jgi:hypothetical protein
MKSQTESILSEIEYLKPQEGVSVITNYGTEELRKFARGLIVCRCPECESTEGMTVDNNQERRLCRGCGAWYRPEDMLVVALIKAFQVGEEAVTELPTGGSPVTSL